MVNPEDIKKRQRFIDGTPLLNRLQEAKFTRRDGNFVETPKVENIEFDTFFDYEEDLSDITASNKQIFDDGPLIMEREESSIAMTVEESRAPTAQHGMLGAIPQEEDVTPIIMRPVYKKDLDNKQEIDDEQPSKRAYDDVVGFEFIRCEYTMKNGNRCRRQAPKNDSICSIHKKILKKEQQS